MKYPFLLLGSCLLWGLTYITLKEGVQDMSISYFQLWRYGVGLLVIYFFFRQSLHQTSWKEHLKGIGIIGSIQFATSLTFTVGLTYSSPSTSAFLFALSCGIVPLLYWIHQKKCPSQQEWWGIILCLVGVVVLTQPFSMKFHWGDFILLFSVVLYSYWIIVMDFFAKSGKSNGIGLSFYNLVGCTVGFAGLTVYEMFTKKTTISFIPSGWGVWLNIFFLGVVCSGLLNILQGNAQKHVSPTLVIIIFSLEPVFTAIFEWLIYRTIPNINMVVGGSSIFLATLFSMGVFPTKKPEQKYS